MLEAEVGDDVYSEDPTVNRLEQRVAEYFGKESAVFVPSGTMANQIAIRIHTHPGDELLTELTNHIILWEQGGPAVLSGVTCRTIEGKFGILSAEQFEGKTRPEDMHSVRTRLVCLENTHNRGGGTIYPLDTIKGVAVWARRHGLAMHLDGARIWNAIAETGIDGKPWAESFDTVAVCFSKGLGAPIGSALIGPRDLIHEARRVRKLFGGAMRQAGFLAAAALYAIEHHVERLRDDHANARLIGDAVRETDGLKLVPPRVETNVVWFEVDPKLGTARDVTDRLRRLGILLAPLGERVVRACTHLDVSKSDCERAAEIIRRFAAA